MALQQTNTVVKVLREAHPHLETMAVPVTSLGDRDMGPLSEIGGKGAFVRALDEALLRGDVELSVSCAKDLPSPHDRLPGITVGAVLPRDDARDALVFPDGASQIPFSDLPAGTRIGTSAPRRIAQLRSFKRYLVPVALRGNLNTRLARLDDGTAGADVLVVAHAGLRRIGAADRVAEVLDTTMWLPASGAGIVVVEHRADDQAMADLLTPLTHRPTHTALRAERACLAALYGNCVSAVSAHATLHADGDLHVHGAVFAPDGSTMIKADSHGPAKGPETVGRETAARLLKNGAADLLPPQPAP
jgi:hydroxymethylbilane synthase